MRPNLNLNLDINRNLSLNHNHNLAMAAYGEARICNRFRNRVGDWVSNGPRVRVALLSTMPCPLMVMIGIDPTRYAHSCSQLSVQADKSDRSHSRERHPTLQSEP